jgi:hypothetical protein
VIHLSPPRPVRVALALVLLAAGLLLGARQLSLSMAV